MVKHLSDLRRTKNMFLNSIPQVIGHTLICVKTVNKHNLNTPEDVTFSCVTRIAAGMTLNML